MDGGIDDEENSGGVRDRIVRIYGVVSNESDSQAKNIHLMAISNKSKGKTTLKTNQKH